MPPIGGVPGQQQPTISPDVIARLLQTQGTPGSDWQTSFFPDPTQGQGNTPVPLRPPDTSSAPPSGVISSSMSGAPSAAPSELPAPARAAPVPMSASAANAAQLPPGPPSGVISSSISGAPQSMPSFAAPEDKQRWLSEHPVATPQPRLGPFDKIPDGQPGADTWANRHNDFRRVLASLFAGMAEYGGAMNRHPGQGAAIFDRWADQDQGNRQFNATLPAQKQQAENAAYDKYIEQQKGVTDIEKDQAQIPNIRANVPALQRQQEFLGKVRVLKENGKYASDLDLFNSVLPEAATIPGMTRAMIVDQINGAKTLGSKYTLTRDPQTQAPIELVDRQGNHYSQSNLPKDPEAQQMWGDAQTAAKQKEAQDPTKAAMQDWLAKNPGKGPADYEEYMKKIVPGYRFQLESGGIGNQPLNSHQQATRDAILEGRSTPPSGFALSTPYWQQVMGGVFEKDPQFNEQRAELRKDFTVGKHSSEINAANTALGHVGVLGDAIDALNDKNGLKVLNSLAQKLGAQTGSDSTTVFNTIVHRVGPELSKAYIGAGGSAGERGSDEKDFDPSLGPQQLKSNVGITAKLLRSKIGALENQWDQNKSDTMPSFQDRFLTPEAKQQLNKWSPQAPNQAGAGQGGQNFTPQTHTWSKSAWQRANPKGDVAAAEAAATKQGYQVQP